MRGLIAAAIAALLTYNVATAATFTDKALFDAQTGGGTTIDFSELGPSILAIPLTNQYNGGVLDLGVDFTLATISTASIVNDSGFLNDGQGIRTNDPDPAVIGFAEDQNFFGVTFPGATEVTLFDGETMVASASFANAGNGSFLGFSLGATTFNRAELVDNEIGAGFYDDIQFGFQAVPVPAIMPVFAGVLILILGWSRRIRSSC